MIESKYLYYGDYFAISHSDSFLTMACIPTKEGAKYKFDKTNDGKNLNFRNLFQILPEKNMKYSQLQALYEAKEHLKEPEKIDTIIRNVLLELKGKTITTGQRYRIYHPSSKSFMCFTSKKSEKVEEAVVETKEGQPSGANPGNGPNEDVAGPLPNSNVDPTVKANVENTETKNEAITKQAVAETAQKKSEKKEEADVKSENIYLLGMEYKVSDKSEFEFDYPKEEGKTSQKPIVFYSAKSENLIFKGSKDNIYFSKGFQEKATKVRPLVSDTSSCIKFQRIASLEVFNSPFVNSGIDIFKLKTVIDGKTYYVCKADYSSNSYVLLPKDLIDTNIVPPSTFSFYEQSDFKVKEIQYLKFNPNNVSKIPKQNTFFLQDLMEQKSFQSEILRKINRNVFYSTEYEGNAINFVPFIDDQNIEDFEIDKIQRDTEFKLMLFVRNVPLQNLKAMGFDPDSTYVDKRTNFKSLKGQPCWFEKSCFEIQSIIKREARRIRKKEIVENHLLTNSQIERETKKVALTTFQEITKEIDYFYEDVPVPEMIINKNLNEEDIYPEIDEEAYVEEDQLEEYFSDLHETFAKSFKYLTVENALSGNVVKFTLEKVPQDIFWHSEIVYCIKYFLNQSNANEKDSIFKDLNFILNMRTKFVTEFQTLIRQILGPNILNTISETNEISNTIELFHKLCDQNKYNNLWMFENKQSLYPQSVIQAKHLDIISRVLHNNEEYLGKMEIEKVKHEYDQNFTSDYLASLLNDFLTILKAEKEEEYEGMQMKFSLRINEISAVFSKEGSWGYNPQDYFSYFHEDLTLDKFKHIIVKPIIIQNKISFMFLNPKSQEYSKFGLLRLVAKNFLLDLFKINIVLFQSDRFYYKNEEFLHAVYPFDGLCEILGADLGETPKEIEINRMIKEITIELIHILYFDDLMCFSPNVILNEPLVGIEEEETRTKLVRKLIDTIKGLFIPNEGLNEIPDHVILPDRNYLDKKFPLESNSEETRKSFAKYLMNLNFLDLLFENQMIFRNFLETDFFLDNCETTLSFLERINIEISKQKEYSAWKAVLQDSAGILKSLSFYYIESLKFGLAKFTFALNEKHDEKDKGMRKSRTVLEEIDEENKKKKILSKKSKSKHIFSQEAESKITNFREKYMKTKVYEYLKEIPTKTKLTETILGEPDFFIREQLIRISFEEKDLQKYIIQIFDCSLSKLKQIYMCKSLIDEVNGLKNSIFEKLIVMVSEQDGKYLVRRDTEELILEQGNMIKEKLFRILECQLKKPEMIPNFRNVVNEFDFFLNNEVFYLVKPQEALNGESFLSYNFNGESSSKINFLLRASEIHTRVYSMLIQLMDIYGKLNLDYRKYSPDCKIITMISQIKLLLVKILGVFAISMNDETNARRLKRMIENDMTLLAVREKTFNLNHFDSVLLLNLVASVLQSFGKFYSNPMIFSITNFTDSIIEQILKSFDTKNFFAADDDSRACRSCFYACTYCIEVSPILFIFRSYLPMKEKEQDVLFDQIPTFIADFIFKMNTLFNNISYYSLHNYVEYDQFFQTFTNFSELDPKYRNVYDRDEEWNLSLSKSDRYQISWKERIYMLGLFFNKLSIVYSYTKELPDIYDEILKGIVNSGFSLSGERNFYPLFQMPFHNETKLSIMTFFYKNFIKLEAHSMPDLLKKALTQMIFSLAMETQLYISDYPEYDAKLNELEQLDVPRGYDVLNEYGLYFLYFLPTSQHQSKLKDLIEKEKQLKVPFQKRQIVKALKLLNKCLDYFLYKEENYFVIEQYYYLANTSYISMLVFILFHAIRVIPKYFDSTEEDKVFIEYLQGFCFKNIISLHKFFNQWMANEDSTAFERVYAYYFKQMFNSFFNQPPINLTPQEMINDSTKLDFSPEKDHFFKNVKKDAKSDNLEDELILYLEKLQSDNKKIKFSNIQEKQKISKFKYILEHILESESTVKVKFLNLTRSFSQYSENKLYFFKSQDEIKQTLTNLTLFLNKTSMVDFNDFSMCKAFERNLICLHDFITYNIVQRVAPLNYAEEDEELSEFKDIVTSTFLKQCILQTQLMKKLLDMLCVESIPSKIFYLGVKIINIVFKEITNIKDIQDFFWIQLGLYPGKEKINFGKNFQNILTEVWKDIFNEEKVINVLLKEEEEKGDFVNKKPELKFLSEKFSNQNKKNIKILKSVLQCIKNLCDKLNLNWKVYFSDETKILSDIIVKVIMLQYNKVSSRLNISLGIVIFDSVAELIQGLRQNILLPLIISGEVYSNCCLLLSNNIQQILEYKEKELNTEKLEAKSSKLNSKIMEILMIVSENAREEEKSSIFKEIFSKNVITSLVQSFIYFVNKEKKWLTESEVNELKIKPQVYIKKLKKTILSTLNVKRDEFSNSLLTGINYFILSKKASKAQFEKSLQDAKLSPEDEHEFDVMWDILELFVANIEILNEKGELKSVEFPKYVQCFALKSSDRDRAIDGIERVSYDTKIGSFFQMYDSLRRTIEQNHMEKLKLRERIFTFFLKFVKQIRMILAITLCVIFLCMNYDDLIETRKNSTLLSFNTEIQTAFAIVAIIQFAFSLLFPLIMIYDETSEFEYYKQWKKLKVSMINTYKPLSNDEIIDLVLDPRKLDHQKCLRIIFTKGPDCHLLYFSSLKNIGKMGLAMIQLFFMKIKCMIFHFRFMRFLIDFVFCALTLWDPIFTPFQIFFQVIRSKLIVDVMFSIKKNATPFIVSITLGLVVILIYTFVGFFFLLDTFGIDDDKFTIWTTNATQKFAALSPPDNTTENKTALFTFPNIGLLLDNASPNLCDTPWECYLNIITFGLRAGGGIGDIISKTYLQTDNKYKERWVYDFTFFILVKFILLNVIFGIIIRTFAKIKDTRIAAREDQLNKCFICSKERSYLDKIGGGFAHHTSNEHNMWNYFFYLYFLSIKKPENFNFTESYIWDSFKMSNFKWVPYDRAISVEKQTEVEESVVSVISSKVSDTITFTTKSQKDLLDQLNGSKKFTSALHTSSEKLFSDFVGLMLKSRNSNLEIPCCSQMFSNGGFVQPRYQCQQCSNITICEFCAKGCHGRHRVVFDKVGMLKCQCSKSLSPAVLRENLERKVVCTNSCIGDNMKDSYYFRCHSCMNHLTKDNIICFFCAVYCHNKGRGCKNIEVVDFKATDKDCHCHEELEGECVALCVETLLRSRRLCFWETNLWGKLVFFDDLFKVPSTTNIKQTHFIQPTVGIDFVSKQLVVEGKPVKLQLWDTAGQERFRSLIPSYVKDAHFAIIVFDVCSDSIHQGRTSLENIDFWANVVRENRGTNIVIVLVANKIDEEQKRFPFSLKEK